MSIDTTSSAEYARKIGVLEDRIAELERTVESNPSSLLSAKLAEEKALIELVKKLGPSDCEQSSDCQNGYCFYCNTKDGVARLAALEQRSPSRG